MIENYRRRYTPIKAIQYTGENHAAVSKFVGDSWKHWVYTSFSSERWVALFRSGSYDQFAYVGDYIVELENGIFKSYKAEAFEGVFEKEPA